LSVLALAIGVTAASAQPSDDRAKAAAHFKQGQEFFKVNDYDRALKEYQAAFELSHEPLLVFNIALCHDRANRPEQALDGFKHYLDLAPNGSVAGEAREDVARLAPIVDTIRAERTAEEARRRDQLRREQAERDATAAQRARVAAEAEQRSKRRRTLETTTARLERRARIERWSAVASGTVGVISFAIATKYGLDARSAANAITQHDGPWTDALLARDAEGHRAGTKAIVFAGVGGTALVGASVLYLFGRHHDTKANGLRLELQPTSGGGSASIVVSF
jgi:tetratricopeptide (TPR) repeat protein